MKNILKVWLRKNQQNRDSTEFTTRVMVKGVKGMSDIVDELVNEGITVDRETALDLISRFNRKSADLVLSGYNVNNGLVNLRTSVKGALNDGKWNPAVNWVDVTITPGKNMYEAVAETTVELLGEKDVTLELYDLANQTNQFIQTSQYTERLKTNTPTLKIAGEPACGMAFRQWLCRA